MSRRCVSAERGFTLLEMLITLVIAGLVFSAALSFLRQQGLAFSLGMNQMTVLQNHRFTSSTLEKDLRTVGAAVPTEQPVLVYADADILAFNADYASNVLNQDIRAVYVDTAAPLAAVSSLTLSRRTTLPGTSFSYPNTTYMEDGQTESAAETIIFFFAPDSSSAGAEDYVLFRQVNDLAPEVVARNLRRTQVGGATLPFFQYMRAIDSQSAKLEPVSTADLPLAHSVSNHGAPADTGAAQQIDLLRGVRVNFTATDGRNNEQEQFRTVSRLFRFPNLGAASVQMCGDRPVLGGALSAQAVQVNGSDAVELSWNPATDETGGEKDVVRYVIWRSSTNGNWGQPYRSFPVGQPTYLQFDTNVVVGQSYYYAIAAQDCSPSNSDLSTAGPVVIP